MKITFLKDDLKEALAKISSAVPTKTQLPILTGVLLTAEKKELTLTGYNLETGIRTTITEVIIQEEGKIVVNAKVRHVHS